jgi:ABC-type glycerol-3-phosphate transport system substrate-binding protein
MKSRTIAFLSACLFCLTALPGCSQNKDAYQVNNSLLSEDSTVITIGGSSEDFQALENVINGFEKIYPNCQVNYEFIANYDKAMPTKLAADQDKVDIFMTKNIQKTSAFYDYALELYSQGSKLSLAHTFPGFTKNFEILGQDTKELYSVPLGGEIRGMYVNKGLLKEQNLSVPTNLTEFYSCCKDLLANGYLPCQSNPSGFGTNLLYPYISNLIANSSDYQKTYDLVNSCDDSAYLLFQKPYEIAYELVKEGYYNYNYAEKNLKHFTDGKDFTTELSFLNLVAQTDGTYAEGPEKARCAFMPGVFTLNQYMEKIKNDYHSTVDFDFILSPVGEKGGYGYLSPASGIAINKKSDRIDWDLEFFNYLFTPEVNKEFASIQNIIPNTTDAFAYVTSLFSASTDRICELGQVTFDYVFYDLIKNSLIPVTKANNPKYMVNSGEAMYPFDYYFSDTSNANSLRSLFAAKKALLASAGS